MAGFYQSHRFHIDGTSLLGIDFAMLDGSPFETKVGVWEEFTGNNGDNWGINGSFMIDDHMLGLYAKVSSSSPFEANFTLDKDAGVLYTTFGDYQGHYINVTIDDRANTLAVRVAQDGLDITLDADTSKPSIAVSLAIGDDLTASASADAVANTAAMNLNTPDLILAGSADLNALMYDVHGELTVCSESLRPQRLRHEPGDHDAFDEHVRDHGQAVPPQPARHDLHLLDGGGRDLALRAIVQRREGDH